MSILLATNMIQVGRRAPPVDGRQRPAEDHIRIHPGLEPHRSCRGRRPGIPCTRRPSLETGPTTRASISSLGPVLTRRADQRDPVRSPVPKRALHAALSILVRHGLGLRTNADAVRFDPNAAGVASVKRHLLGLGGKVDRPELESTEAHLDRPIDHWATVAEQQRRDGSPMFYRAGRQHRRLLKRFYESRAGRPSTPCARSIGRVRSMSSGAHPVPDRTVRLSQDAQPVRRRCDLRRPWRVLRRLRHRTVEEAQRPAPERAPPHRRLGREGASGSAHAQSELRRPTLRRRPLRTLPEVALLWVMQAHGPLARPI